MFKTKAFIIVMVVCCVLLAGVVAMQINMAYMRVQEEMLNGV